jgi:hypothetical protein
MERDASGELYSSGAPNQFRLPPDSNEERSRDNPSIHRLQRNCIIFRAVMQAPASMADSPGSS